MASTWRPPLPKGFGKRARGPRVLAALALILSTPIVALVGGEWLLRRDPALPRLERVADYQPLALTRVFGSQGALIGEVVGARRIVAPPADVPHELAEAVVAAREPAFFTRPPLGQLDFLRATWARLRGRAEPSN